MFAQGFLLAAQDTWVSLLPAFETSPGRAEVLCRAVAAWSPQCPPAAPLLQAVVPMPSVTAVFDSPPARPPRPRADSHSASALPDQIKAAKKSWVEVNENDFFSHRRLEPRQFQPSVAARPPEPLRLSPSLSPSPATREGLCNAQALTFGPLCFLTAAGCEGCSCLRWVGN